MLRIILAPVLGGVIGYITNDLAIRMLFRPRKPVMLGKWRLPFTPGLIPRQKARIAASVGAAVSGELLNRETLAQTLLSDTVRDALRAGLDDMFRDMQNDPQPVRDRLSAWFGEDSVSRCEASVREKGADYLTDKLVGADAGSTVVRAVLQSLREKPGFGLLVGLTDESLVRHLGSRINRLIEQNGPAYLDTEIGRLEDEWLGQPVSTLCRRYEDRFIPLREWLLSLYERIITRKLGDVLSVVDISRIIVDRINAFDEAELEALILGIMKKELRAIVWLGALLGTLMGFLNLLM